MKHRRAYLLLFLKGMGIGSADIIPGVSGGTIALITGIYEELLEAIQSFNADAFRLLQTGKLKALWQHLHGAFLLPLVAGIGLSLATTVHLVSYLLTYHPIQTWSFFFGLILVSSFAVYQQIKQWHARMLLASLGGALLAYGITRATPMLYTPQAGWFIALAGALAVCAMILPGISGSFILLLLGKYTLMLDALRHFKVGILATFALGGVAGLLSFSRLIAWLLRQYHDYTLALLAGFILGSLNKVWPWKQLLSQAGMLDSSMAATQNLSPLQFQNLYQQDPLVPQALLWMSIGVLLVVGIEKQGRHKKLSA
jgi:putative membrane protein